MTDRCGNSSGSCASSPTFLWCMGTYVPVAVSVKTLSRALMRPLVGTIVPASAPAMVDLPAPLGPMIPSTRPIGSSKAMSNFLEGIDTSNSNNSVASVICAPSRIPLRR